VPKFEITEERDSLGHANVTIGFEAYICNWSSRVNETKDILSDDIQPWCLNTHQKKAIVKIRLPGILILFKTKG